MINRHENLLEAFWKPARNPPQQAYELPIIDGPHGVSYHHFYLFIAYNNLIPMVNPQQGRTDENYKKLKKDYDAELARDAPPYLAHIESYNQDLTDMSDMSKGKQMKKGRCTGSLISTQHVLTYV